MKKKIWLCDLNSTLCSVVVVKSLIRSNINLLRIWAFFKQILRSVTSNCVLFSHSVCMVFFFFWLFENKHLPRIACF